jgi:hypothetical protein
MRKRIQHASGGGELILVIVMMLFASLGQQSAQARPMDLVKPQRAVNFEQLYQFARLASDTYASESAIRDRHPGVSWIATPGHTNVLYFVKTDHASKQHIVAVRGTVDDINWDLDMDTHGAFDKKAGVLVHRGFHTVARTIYADLRGQLKPAYRTYFTGHSLGGAVAAILATYLDRDGYGIGGVYTFGQPKFTNAAGARAYRDLPLIRVVYQNDIVAALPNQTDGDEQLYAHIGPVINLLSGPHYIYLNRDQTLNISQGSLQTFMTQISVPDHKMKWYLQGLKDKIDHATPVAVKDRNKYIVRHKMGVGVETAPTQKKFNFNQKQ